MGTRRQSREAALQMLYISDTCRFSNEEIINSYFGSLCIDDNAIDFAKNLFIGTLENISTLDNIITSYAENWELKRMAAVDRNILRLAAYELLDTPETPVNVIIDEAVEIAKKYSTNESGKFVNGILDKLKSIRKANA